MAEERERDFSSLRHLSSVGVLETVAVSTTQDEEDIGDLEMKYIKLSDVPVSPTDNPKVLESEGVMQTSICSRWQVKRCIGKGSFGQIYLAEDMHTKEQVAVKMEPKIAKLPQLWHEARIYRMLQGQKGFIRVRGMGEDSTHRMLVLDLLGPSLEDLFDLCARRFSQKTVLALAIQIVTRLEQLHARGICHRDIKPDNFLMGLDKQGGVVFLIDFGLSKPFLDPKTGAHIGERERKISDLVGTARYCSVRSHQGLQLSRKDDLESAAYLLCYLATPGLPWQGLRASTLREKYDKIGRMKLAAVPGDMCRGLLPCFAAFLDYARGLGFQDAPDYERCRALFRDAMAAGGLPDDGAWDWSGQLSRGRLSVGVVAARNLAGKKPGGLSDPYCTVGLTAGGGRRAERVRTACVRADLNPTWDARFEFAVADPAGARVGVYVWSRSGGLLPDRFLGRVVVPLADLPDRVVRDEWHGLQKRSARSRVSGDIHLRLHYRRGLAPPD